MSKTTSSATFSKTFQNGLTGFGWVPLAPRWLASYFFGVLSGRLDNSVMQPKPISRDSESSCNARSRRRGPICGARPELSARTAWVQHILSAWPRRLLFSFGRRKVDDYGAIERNGKTQPNQMNIKNTTARLTAFSVQLCSLNWLLENVNSKTERRLHIYICCMLIYVVCWSRHPSRTND